MLNGGINIANKFGKWKVSETIGQGGQGQIHLVKDSSSINEGVFALKRLMNINRLNRFKDEIKACMELEHPNIVKVVDYDYDNSHPFMVMEYYENGTLNNLDLNSYSLEDKLILFRKICVAVAFAHENSVVHRDLKPENIFLNNDNEPVVGDFGLCYSDDEGDRITLTEEAVGSRYYMAPELEDGKIEEVSYSSDVYSLGKILYWLITGNIFSREKHHEGKYDITQNNQNSKFYLINEFLDKMINSDPKERLESSGVVLKELNILIRRIGSGANCIAPGIPQTCIYCGLGKYVKLPKYDPLHSSVVNTYFKFRNDDGWIFFVCDHCANIQIFRPNMLNDTINMWEKEDNKL